MDIPVKKLTRLLKPDQPAEVRAAAVLVLAELGAKDAEVFAELIDRLDDENEAVRIEAIRAAGKLKVSKALPKLLDRIRTGGEEASLAADAAAKLGAEGVKGLQKLMPEVAPGLRRYIAAALTGAGAAGAEAGVAVLLDRDPQVAAAAASAIIGRIPTMPADRRAALVSELVALASDKKNKLPPSAELPVVRVLAALNDATAAEALWDRAMPPYPTEVRAAALQAVGGWVKSPGKEQWRRLFACAADPAFAVAAPALMVLHRLPASDKQTADWVRLLRAPDVAARRLALEKVGERDTAEVAAALMEQLRHPDRGLRDTARTQLAKLEHGREALAEAVANAGTADEMWPLARSVAPFVRTFPPKLRGTLLEQASEFLEAGDYRADPLLFLLREADAPALRDQLHERAVTRRKKKDYDTALKYLKLLIRDPAVGFPVRLELALCGLKKSDKEVAADARGNDPCLRQFEHILGQNADEVLKQIEKAKWLDAEDLYYLGFHFAERFGKEKDFGVAVLRLVVKASPRTKLATAARSKLKSVAAE
jgi:HEAT repeat protein